MNWRLPDLVALSVITLSVTSGCGELGSQGVALLPVPPPGQIEVSKYQPEKPFLQAAPGLSARLNFAAAEGGYTIEARDFLVAPEQRAVDVEVRGVAVFEVRDGTGTVTVGEKPLAATIGATFAVSEGERLRIEARKGPMVLRAYLFKTQ